MGALRGDAVAPSILGMNWFGIFQRKTLNNAGVSSARQLTQAIHDFTAASNDKAAPFVWRKREVRGTRLRNNIVNLRN